MRQLSPDFRASEFACRCENVNCVYKREDILPVSPRLVTGLQFVRDALGSPIMVLRALVCKESLLPRVDKTHIHGIAADITCTPALYNRLVHLCTSCSDFKYVAVYDNYIHVDVGRYRSPRVVDNRGTRNGENGV